MGIKIMKSLTEKQENCRYSFPYQGKNMDQVYCKLKNDKETHYVTPEQCENCEQFKHRYIQFPLTIDGIEVESIETRGTCIGSPVRVMPCAEKYKGKTFLGLYLGELPWCIHGSHNEEDNKLHIDTANNPAIYVFELQKIIYGFESYWNIIENPKQFVDITQEMIESQWYVRLLKEIFEKK